MLPVLNRETSSPGQMAFIAIGNTFKFHPKLELSFDVDDRGLAESDFCSKSGGFVKPRFQNIVQNIYSLVRGMLHAYSMPRGQMSMYTLPEIYYCLTQRSRGYFKYYGRTDDQVVHNTGGKGTFE